MTAGPARAGSAQGKAGEGALGLTVFYYPATAQFRRLSTGPNAGMGLVWRVPWEGDPRAPAPPGIYLGLGLNPIDGFYQQQTGPSPYCARQQMDSVAGLLLTHEQRHYTLTRAALEPIAIQDSMERVLVFPGQPRASVDSLWTRVRLAWVDSVNAGYKATHADSVTYPSCTLRGV